MVALGVGGEDIATILGTVGSLKDQIVSNGSRASLTADLRQQQSETSGDGLSIVVMAAGKKQFGLIVDRVYDTEEIVVKPLSHLLKDVGVFAGATLMGDGQAALILDTSGLVKAADIATDEEIGTDFMNSEERQSRESTDKQTILVFNINTEEQMAVPLTLISRLETVRATDIRTSINGKVIPYRDRLLPLAFLEDHVDISRPPADRETVKVLVFEIEHSVGLVVSEIVDSVEIPVDLDDSSISKRGFSGVAIVNSEPTAFVDIYQVIEMAYPDWFKRDKEIREETADKDNIVILLAEDSSFYRNVEKGYLMQEGFQVIEAEDGKVAMEVLASRPVDLLVTDIEMPNVNGFELAEHVRATERLRHIPIIAVTSLSNDTERERGTAVGIDAYLIKLQREVLMREVFRLLKSKRAMN
jgi:two-component system chemotaxis sensor kinase CheA